MSLDQQITADMKSAMKSRMNATLSTLRLLRSAIKNKQIDLGHELSDEEIQAVIKSQVKQLKDSIVSYQDGGREDMADSAKVEVVVLEAYMPAQMDDEELEGIVKQAVEASGVTGIEDMGKAMGASMKAVAGRADGNRVKEIVGKLLSVFTLVVVGTFSSGEVHAAIDLLTSEPALDSDIVLWLRVIRVLLLWVGIFAVNSILHGGFHYMISSNRDEEHITAWKKITSGFLGSIVVVTLFVIATIYIEIL